MKEYFLILVSAALVNNFVLVRFLGICPFLGVSKKTETAVGMGFAVMFVMTLASFITYTVQTFFLNPTNSNIFYKIILFSGKKVNPEMFDFRYLQTVIFILTIASLVQLTEMIIKKFSPVLYKGLGIFLPLITTNCAVLGVAIINIQQTDFNLLKAVLHGFGAALGFTLALIMMSGLREKFELNDIPKPFRGAAIALITAGILSLCFMGLSGI